MEVKLERENTRLIARLRGEIDHHTAGELRRRIDEAVAGGQATELILDFSEISFMDSSGIGLILGRYKLMQGRQGTLKVRGAGARQRAVMKMAGLEQLRILEDKGEDTNETHQ